MKKILICLFCGVSLCATAKEEPAFFAEDFANQSMIYVQGDKTSQSCQAVRILPEWYLTAAHCVSPVCNRQCQIRVQLLSGELDVSAIVKHQTGTPQVFVPASYHGAETRSIRADIALIHFNPSEEEYMFLDVPHKAQVDQAAFIKLLNQSKYAFQRGQWQALEQARPKLLVIPHSINRKLSFPIAVPDLRSGELYFKQSAGADFYYFTQLHHYIGPNFGVERGMSGGGVVLPGGTVVGVVSASLNHNAYITAYKETDEPVQTHAMASNYFLFTPISRENAAFIQATIASYPKHSGTPRVSSVNGYYAQPTSAKLEDIFAEFSSERDIQHSQMQ